MGACARTPRTHAAAGAAHAVVVLGLGIVGLTQWFMKGRKLIEDAATRNAGELK